jgi:lactate permease
MLLLACSPILLLLFLLVGARWSAAASGAAAATVAAAVAYCSFGYGEGPATVAGPVLEALFFAISILWIIFPALCIHEYQTRSGATEQIGRWLGSISSDRRIIALLVAWFFALFLEGAAGFGTPVALAAPLLVTLGFPPLKALTLVLVGHAAGVSFGAVGTPLFALVGNSGLDVRELSLAIVLLHAALGWMLCALVFKLAGSPTRERHTGRGWIGIAAFAFFLPAALLAWLVGGELPTLGGALLGGIGFAAFLARSKVRGDQEAPTPRALLAAALPYLILLLLLLLTRIVEPIGAILRGFSYDWSLAEQFGGSIAPFYHPGSMLLLAFGVAALLRRDAGIITASADAAARRLPIVALALVSVLLLARLMVHSGMIEMIALAAANSFGSYWPLVSPAVGALGSFITGSGTASNILFGELQLATAGAVGLSPLLIAAAQGFGAAVGNIITPHNIVAGAATVGLVGREGEVLRKTLPICLVYAGAGGVLVLGLSVI